MSLNQRLEKLEQRVVANDRRAEETPSTVKPFDWNGFAKLLDAFDVIRARPAIDTPRDHVRNRVAAHLEAWREYSPNLPRTTDERIDRHTDRVMEVDEAGWQERHRLIYGSRT